MKCANCPFANAKAIRSEVHRADLLVVGEAPGVQEIRQGKPFTGPSGQLLWGTFAKMGIEREQVAVTNALSCAIPPTVDKTRGLREACMACRSRLMEDVEQVRPKVILALGGTSMQALTLNFGFKVTQERGLARRLNGPGSPWVVPALHPAYILRAPVDYSKLALDTHYSVHLMRGGEPRDPGDTKWKLITAPEEFEKAKELIRKAPYVGADIETSDINPRKHWIQFLGVTYAKNKTLIFRGEDIPKLKDVLEDPNVRWEWWNGKFDTSFIRQLGIDAQLGGDGMLRHYCLAPDTKILKRDLSWVRADELSVDDDVVGFEYSMNHTSHTQRLSLGDMVPTKVEALKRQTAPCYRIVTDCGEVISSAKHSWPVRKHGYSAQFWIQTEDLAKLHEDGVRLSIPFYAEPWEYADTREAGYIAGILDGEGHITSGWTGKDGTKSAWVLGFAQNPGLVLDRTLAFLDAYGFRYRTQIQAGGKCVRVHFAGYRETVRALGMLRPTRLLQDSDKLWIGRRKNKPAQIVRVEYLGEREVIGIQTGTQTLVANGFLTHNCLDENRGNHGLKQQAAEQLGAPDYDAVVKKHVGKGENGWAKVPAKILVPYLARDADYTFQLVDIFDKRLDKVPGLRDLYENHLLPTSRFLQRVEETGIWVSKDHLETVAFTLATEIDEIQGRIQEVVEPVWDADLYADQAGAKTVPAFFNPKSPKQLSWVIYERFRLRVPGKQGIRDTREETLNSLPPHPLIRELLRYRTVMKQMGTYAEGILREVEADGRVHSTFLIHGTATGRLSSREPNMQNIPRNAVIRDLFQAPPGYLLLDTDFDQAELRMLAHLSEDPQMLGIYREGRKLHHEVATDLFGPDFTKDQYMRAKAVNFGIAYGRTAVSLAMEFGISMGEAQAMVDNWFARFPDAHKYINDQRYKPLAGKHLISPFGRRRRYSFVPPEARKNVQNEAANFAIQSAASDLTLKTAMGAEDDIVALGGKIVNLVHDSILVEIPHDKKVAYGVLETLRASSDRVVRNELEGLLDFPMDAKVGKGWGSAQDIDEFDWSSGEGVAS